MRVQLRRVAAVGNKKSAFEDSLRPYIGLEHITSWTGEIIASDDATPEGLVAHFEKGDILFGKLRPYLAKVAAPKFRGVCSTEALVVKPGKRVETRFLRYSVSAPSFIDRVNAATYGAKMPRASWENIGTETIWVPDLATQRRIADFLDRETARIDLLIEKKQRLVALLGEKEAAFIESIVTNAFTFQPSRNQNIRDDGWMLTKLKNLSSRLKVGVVVNPSEYIDDDGEIPFIYGGNIREYSIDFTDCRRMSAESSRRLKASQLRPGDVVVVRVGAPGVAAVIPNSIAEANCASIMCVTSKACSGEWLAYAFNTRFVRYQVEVVQYGAAQKQFNLEHAREFTIPVPPRAEEAILIERIRAFRYRNVKIKNTTLQSIDRLKEYRSALITAAVTGQIDVTTYAKPGIPDRRLDAIQEEMGA